MVNNKYEINIGGGSLLFIQFILLILHYGKVLIMPLWLVWLPAIIIGSIIGLVLIVLFIVFIAWIGKEVLER